MWPGTRTRLFTCNNASLSASTETVFSLEILSAFSRKERETNVKRFACDVGINGIRCVERHSAISTRGLPALTWQ